MKTVDKMGHQGDCFLKRICDLGEVDINALEAVKADEDGTLTILKGEATHHHHLFPKNANVKIYPHELFPEGSKIDTYLGGKADGLKKFVVIIKEPIELQHFHVEKKELTKEHSTIVCPPGVYRFNNQRQTNWENEIIRVMD